MKSIFQLGLFCSVLILLVGCETSAHDQGEEVIYKVSWGSRLALMGCGAMCFLAGAGISLLPNLHGLVKKVVVFVVFLVAGAVLIGLGITRGAVESRIRAETFSYDMHSIPTTLRFDAIEKVTVSKTVKTSIRIKDGRRKKSTQVDYDLLFETKEGKKLYYDPENNITFAKQVLTVLRRKNVPISYEGSVDWSGEVLSDAVKRVVKL